MSHQGTHQTSAPALDRGLLLLGGVVVAGTITAILDATIVNVAIPTLGRAFAAPVSTIQWVITAYLLALASAIPLSGWLAGRIGAKRVWVGALAAFTSASVLAGLSWSVEALIVFRVLQGLAAGLLMPVGQAILAQAAGPQRIGRVMSLVGIPMLLAPVFGPVLGGAIVDSIGWRFVFLVNVPVGLAAVGLALRYLPASAPRPVGRLDLRGLALLSPGLAVLLYALSEAGTAGGVGAPRVVAALAVGAGLVAAFAAHAWRRGTAALLDVTLFARRGFAAAAGTNLLVGIALFGALILLPLYLQLVRGESPLATGLLLAPQGLGAALAMPLAGRLTDELGARRVIPAGILLALLGTAAFTQVAAGTPYPLLAAALFVIGLGLGATIMPSMAVAYASVPREAVPSATSAINVIQRVAASFGTALLAVVLQREAAGTVPGGLESLAALSPGEREAAAPALAEAFGTAFSVALVLVAAALVPALLLPRRQAAMTSGAAARPIGESERREEAA